MDRTLTDLHPAPSEVPVADALVQLRATLDQLLAPSLSTPRAPPATPSRACTLLRQRLAVRGWVSPLALLADVADAEREDALAALAHEVELAERTRPGQWFMGLAARKQVFSSTDLERLQRHAGAVLYPGDEDDPLRLALQFALRFAPEAALADVPDVGALLDPQPSEVLQQLARMAAWGGAIPGLQALAAAAGAQRQRRVRDRQLEAMGATTLFGREAEQARLHEFLRAPPQAWQVRVLYVSGIGGSGKSALLLSAEQALRHSASSLVLRLDFDNPALDPLSLERMDILFLRALAVEEPALAAGLQTTIVQLQTLAEHRMRERIDAQGEVQSSSAARTTHRGAQQIKQARYATRSGSAAEGAGFSEGYERISALASVRELPAFRQRGVVLFLDTLENVSRLGADAIDSVLRWLASIADSVPARALRVVLAGRDRLAAQGPDALARRLQEHGLLLEADREVALGDLDPQAASALLQRFGMPADDAALAAAALPRNPLVLRLAAQAHLSGKTDLAALQQDYRAGRIDRTTASGYLAQRVVQHVPGEPARRYAVAAMALPALTERHLRDIVIPAVDGSDTAADRKLARKVYQGLRRATWLTIEDKPGTLRWHTELRQLALPMVQADPEHAQVAQRVRSAATATRRAGAVDAAPVQADPDLHRMRLEGVGGRVGEGDRLVGQGQAAQALALYRARPTRAPGVPPTFVLRALALTGDWHQPDADPAAVLQEIRQHLSLRQGHLQRPMVERLYWLTRLEMLRGEGLSRPHVELLRDACRSLRFSPQNGALFGLVCIAEAWQPREGSGGPLSLIAPAAWPPPRADVGPELRFSLVRALHGQCRANGAGSRWVSTTLGAMLTLDERWPPHVAQLRAQQILQVQGTGIDTSALATHMQQMRSAVLVEVEQFIASCRDLRVRLDLARLRPQDGALLRGTLVEFHAPLAALLAEPTLWSAARSPADTLEHLVRFVAQLELPPRTVLTLAEFESRQRRESHARELAAAMSAVVVLLDRALALGAFCRAVAQAPMALFDGDNPAAVQRVVDLTRRYLQWDSAFTPPAATSANQEHTDEP